MPPFDLTSSFARLRLRVRRSVTRAVGPARPSVVPASAPPAPPATTHDYPGDFHGEVPAVYAPRADGRPDPGEVVWAWVPYADDPSQGKDRPALIIGYDDRWLLALPVTSKDHDRDAAQEAAAGRRWMDIGTGAWDRRGRPSEVRLNRVVRLDPRQVRREGAALPRDLFTQVIAAVGPSV